MYSRKSQDAMEKKSVFEAKFNDGILPEVVAFRKTRMQSYVSFRGPMVE
jgi:hypothetical protein